MTPETLVENLNLEDFDALAIPGGFEEAALPVGKSGVLKGRKATTYNLSEGKRQKQLSAFGANVLANQPIVIDRNIITSYNPSTAFDVAFLLLERLTTKENCDHVRTLMGFSSRY